LPMTLKEMFGKMIVMLIRPYLGMCF